MYAPELAQHELSTCWLTSISSSWRRQEAFADDDRLEDGAGVVKCVLSQRQEPGDAGASSMRASRSSGTRIWIVVNSATRTFRRAALLARHGGRASNKLRFVLLAYVDESHASGWYAMAALVTDGPAAVALSDELNRVAAKAARAYGLSRDVVPSDS